MDRKALLRKLLPVAQEHIEQEYGPFQNPGLLEDVQGIAKTAYDVSSLPGRAIAAATSTQRMDDPESYPFRPQIEKFKNPVVRELLKLGSQIGTPDITDIAKLGVLAGTPGFFMIKPNKSSLARKLHKEEKFILDYIDSQVSNQPDMLLKYVDDKRPFVRDWARKKMESKNIPSHVFSPKRVDLKQAYQDTPIKHFQ